MLVIVVLLFSISPAVYADDTITTHLTTSAAAWTDPITFNTYMYATGTLTYTDCVGTSCHTYPFSGQTVTVTFYTCPNSPSSCQVMARATPNTDSNGNYNTGSIFCGWFSCAMTGADAYFAGYSIYPSAFACSGKTPECGWL